MWINSYRQKQLKRFYEGVMYSHLVLFKMKKNFVQLDELDELDIITPV